GRQHCAADPHRRSRTVRALQLRHRLGRCSRPDSDGRRLGGIFGTAYTFDDTLQQSFPVRGNLRVVCDHGTLNISPADDNTLRVVVHKKLYAQNQNDANKYNDGTRPQITITGTAVLLNANTNGAGEHGVESDMDIFVPRDAVLDIASKRGDVTINERKADVKVSLQHGDVALDDITGAAKLSLE